MAISQLSILALRGVLAGATKYIGAETGQAMVDGMVSFFSSRFIDPSQRVIRALERSTERSWRSLEIALAGESLTSRLDRAEDRNFRDRVRLFLEAIARDLPTQEVEFRRQALAELRNARKKGALLPGQPGDTEARALVSFTRFTNPTHALQAEWHLLSQVGEYLQQSGYLHLSKLVQLRSEDGASLIAVAVRFFFRQEIEGDPQLFQGVMAVRLDELEHKLESGFLGLHQALQQHGDRLDEMIESVHIILTQTHSAVLDLKAELLRQGEETRSLIGELVKQIMQLQARLDLGDRELRPSDSFAIRNEAERKAFRQLIAQYRSLPTHRRQSLPALLNAIGKLEVAAGDFETAQSDFVTVARMVGNDPGGSEAYFNAYLASLEQGELDKALVTLKRAIQLEPTRFAPFPVEKYEPIRILGAGGFGVTFLCRYKHTGANVAVKVLTPDGLERDVTTVFQEAGALDEVHHPAIVRLRECDFADRHKTRPYLVMEYFEGPTLDQYLRERGTISEQNFFAVFLPVAEALYAAHSKGVYHRDVKPANLLVLPGKSSARTWQVKVIDFGLALKQSVLMSISGSGGKKSYLGSSIAGTIDYAAPEQLGKLPGAKIGPTADVYGFGRTCCFALFGTPHPLGTHWRKISAGLADVLEQCLHENPEARIKSFAHVVKRLRAIRDKGSRSDSEPINAEILETLEPIIIETGTKGKGKKSTEAEDEERWEDGRTEYPRQGQEKTAFSPRVSGLIALLYTWFCFALMIFNDLSKHENPFLPMVFGGFFMALIMAVPFALYVRSYRAWRFVLGASLVLGVLMFIGNPFFSRYRPDVNTRFVSLFGGLGFGAVGALILGVPVKIVLWLTGSSYKL